MVNKKCVDCKLMFELNRGYETRCLKCYLKKVEETTICRECAIMGCTVCKNYTWRERNLIDSFIRSGNFDCCKKFYYHRGVCGKCIFIEDFSDFKDVRDEIIEFFKDKPIYKKYLKYEDVKPQINTVCECYNETFYMEVDEFGDNCQQFNCNCY